LSIRGKACIAGIYEHPTRKADGRSLAQIHAEVARGALDEGPTLMTSIVDSPAKALENGAAVRLVVRAAADGTLAPMFTLI
jgi:hypothetical protein